MRDLRLINQGKKVYRFGFDSDYFKYLKKLLNLKKNAQKKEYLPMQGLPLEKNIQALLQRTGVSYSKENI